MQQKHPEDESNFFDCDFCGLKTAFKGNMSRHILNVHLKVEQLRFQCSECDKVTNTKLDMESHKVNHHGMRTPFQCIACLKYFASRSHLHHHKKAATCRPRSAYVDYQCEKVENGQYKCLNCSRTYPNFRKAQLVTYD